MNAFVASLKVIESTDYLWCALHYKNSFNFSGADYTCGRTICANLGYYFLYFKCNARQTCVRFFDLFI